MVRTPDLQPAQLGPAPRERFPLSPGVVGLWDLASASPLLRVREADESATLLPYRCFLAHDHAVRALAFCPASR